MIDDGHCIEKEEDLEQEQTLCPRTGIPCENRLLLGTVPEDIDDSLDIEKSQNEKIDPKYRSPVSLFSDAEPVI